MITSEPLHIAFVWHMHQPYYRAPATGVFEMPWVRLHALKDYLDMVEALAAFPDLHQTFNLVPCLIEQLEAYASGDYVDLYWEHTLKSAADLDSAERSFVVERMCDRTDHPRVRSHPRYLELALKREAHASQGWETCAQTFSTQELRDLQVWFNLAWFDPSALKTGPLAELAARGRDFTEDDKQLLAEIQVDLLARVIPAYRAALARGQIEITASPYFHPILPLLANSDSARVATAEVVLPPRRFAHPEDAAEHIERGLAVHERVFGRRPRGMWCSEQAVGEDVIALLLRAGIAWTISDETVLLRSLSGAAVSRFADHSGFGAALGPSVPGAARFDRPAGEPLPPQVLYRPYLLEREQGRMAIVFRDHTLSDLIGFNYHSWDSRDAATDLLRRLSEIRTALLAAPCVAASDRPVPRSRGALATEERYLVTIALDGENAWEYYPNDGHDFLKYLYQGLCDNPAFRCVTVSEHLDEQPPLTSLGWLHTGSWIGGDLRTWIGDVAHNVAWDLLHRTRDLAAPRRPRRPSVGAGDPKTGEDPASLAWHHVLVAEGSDWFWWFGDHHHTDLDHVWDLNFRRHLQQVYRLLGEAVPPELGLPILDRAIPAPPLQPMAVAPIIDGVFGAQPQGMGSEWDGAVVLAEDAVHTMQSSQPVPIREVRFGWSDHTLHLLLIPTSSARLAGLDIEVRILGSAGHEVSLLTGTLEEQGRIEVSWKQGVGLAAAPRMAWRDVVEISIPLDASVLTPGEIRGLTVALDREGATEQVFRTGAPGAPGGRST